MGINELSLCRWLEFKALPLGLVSGTLEQLRAVPCRLQRGLHRMVSPRDILKNLKYHLRIVPQWFERKKVMPAEYLITELCVPQKIPHRGHACPRAAATRQSG